MARHPILVVAATRQPEPAFWTGSPLGQSLQRIGRNTGVDVRVAFGNSRGLPEIYNAHIEAAPDDAALVFVHDDVWVDDLFLSQRVLQGLRHFDVIGVVGTAQRVPGQPSWAFRDTTFAWGDREAQSGVIAHGDRPFGPISYFGDVPKACELLDGVFLAARAGTLRRSGVAFDARFAFHFYDMDFCRTARARGLRLGTWPISLTHRSGGNFTSPAWRSGYDAYIGKWKD